MISLGKFLSGEAQAGDLSNDGMRVVGGWNYLSLKRATVWSPESGLQDLTGVLEASGLDLSGWILNYAAGISDDGRFVTGYGTHLGQQEAFWAELPDSIPKVADPSPLPEPGITILLFASGAVLFAGSRWRRPIPLS